MPGSHDRFWRVAAAAVLALGIAGEATAAARHYYDSQGRLVSIVYDDGKRITYTYDDAGNREAVVTAATAGNLPPEGANDYISVNEGASAYTFYPRTNDTDPEGGSKIMAATTNGDKGTTSFAATSVTYTLRAGVSGAKAASSPPSADATRDSFVYTVRDTANAYDTVVVEVVINNVAPNAVNDSRTVTKNGFVDIPVMANDTDAGQDAIEVISNTTPTHGMALNLGNGIIRYLPTANYTGSDSFVYTLRDEDGATDTATVSLTVSAVNNPPVAGDDAIVVAISGSQVFDPRGNDTDADGNSLTVTARTNGAHGTVAYTGTSLTYTPTTGYSGEDTFTYTISDGVGGTDTANVYVNVIANSPPDAVNDSRSALTATASTFDPRSNDSDADGDILTITAVSTPAHGTVTIQSPTTTGSAVRYTSAGGYTGSDSFTYTVRDPAGATDTATVTMAVSNTNTAPVAVDDTLSVDGYTGQILVASVNAAANDTDVDGQTLTITAKTNGTKGTVAIVGNALSYTTNNTTAVGSDSFTYTISDGAGGTDSGTVNVTITRESPN